MDGSILFRLGVLGLLFAIAVLFFLRPRFGGGKGGAKGNRFYSGGQIPSDGPGSNGEGSD